MSGVGVEFVGGPLDGQQQWVVCDDLMAPSAVYECASMELRRAEDGVAVPAVVRHVYERELSPRDEGPLWLYRWAGERR